MNPASDSPLHDDLPLLCGVLVSLLLWASDPDAHSHERRRTVGECCCLYCQTRLRHCWQSEHGPRVVLHRSSYLPSTCPLSSTDYNTSLAQSTDAAYVVHAILPRRALRRQRSEERSGQ